MEPASLLGLKNIAHIFDEVNYPVFVLKDYRFIYANPAFVKLVGKKNLSKRCSQVFNCSDENSKDCEIQQVIKCQKAFTTLVPFHKKNKECWFNLEVSPLRGKNGEIEAFLFTARDISNFVGLESQVIKTNAELNAINKIALSLTQLDLHGLLEDVVVNVCKVLGIPKAGLHLYEGGELHLKASYGLSKDFLKFVQVHPNDASTPPGLCSSKKEAVYLKDTDKDKSEAVPFQKKEGIKSLVSIPLLANDRLMGTLTVAKKEKGGFASNDISVLSTVAGQIGVAIENARLYKRTTTLSTTDLLTGLYNYKYFEEILRKETKRASRNNLHFSLLMIDLDNLNTLNDFYGHETGDRVLKQFAVILKKNLRRSDYVARFSGDEFIVLLPETDVIKARTVAEKVRRKTKKIRLFGLDKKQAVTASIGIAVYPSSSTIPSALVKAADLAMCHGKQHGKDQVCVYSPGLLTTISFDSRKIKRFAKNADLSTIQTLVTAVDLKDNYTQQHSAEVSRLSVCLAQALGLPEEDLEKLRIAGLLHDIGKIGIPDNILLKPGPLTKAEYSAVKKHPEYGVDILKHSSDFKDTLPIVLHHHEWFNGGGYPHALKKKKIPYLARIIAVTDAYQAMISDRPYREGLTIKEALAELKRCSGDQFDPEMVKTFTSILSKLDTGIAPSNLA